MSKNFASFIQRYCRPKEASCGKCVSAVFVVSCVCVWGGGGGGGGALPHQTTGFLWEVCLRCWCCFMCVWGGGALPHQTTGFLWEVCLRCWCCFMCVSVCGGGGGSLIRRLASCGKCVSAVVVVSCVCVWGGGLFSPLTLLSRNCFFFLCTQCPQIRSFNLKMV